MVKMTCLRNFSGIVYSLYSLFDKILDVYIRLVVDTKKTDARARTAEPGV